MQAKKASRLHKERDTDIYNKSQQNSTDLQGWQQ